jgi:glycosyltransferase involved in cell wall biosynthesis
MEKPLISIITISFNAASEIVATMQSVLEQTYDNIEYLIIDGASKDNTVDIAKKVASDYPKKRTVIISEPDEGLYDAMNKGVRNATGNWCAFMNCGDKYDNKDVILNIFGNQSLLTNKKIVYGRTLLLHEDGTTSFHSTAPYEKLPSIIQKYHPYCHQAAFFNIDDKADCMYDLRYKIGADYDVCCRYYKKYGVKSFLFVDSVVAAYKAYDGVSCDRQALKREHILVKIRNRMSIIEISRNILSYLFKKE